MTSDLITANLRIKRVMDALREDGEGINYLDPILVGALMEAHDLIAGAVASIPPAAPNPSPNSVWVVSDFEPPVLVYRGERGEAARMFAHENGLEANAYVLR